MTKTLKCRFRSTQSGKKMAGIGVTMPRNTLTADGVDELLVGAKLTIILSADPNGQKDVEGQAKILDTVIEDTFEAERYDVSLKPDRFVTSFKIHKDGLDMNRLHAFEYLEGKVKVKRTGNAKPEDEGGKGDKGDNTED